MNEQEMEIFMRQIKLIALQTKNDDMIEVSRNYESSTQDYYILIVRISQSSSVALDNFKRHYNTYIDNRFIDKEKATKVIKTYFQAIADNQAIGEWIPSLYDKAVFINLLCRHSDKFMELYKSYTLDPLVDEKYWQEFIGDKEVQKVFKVFIENIIPEYVKGVKWE